MDENSVFAGLHCMLAICRMYRFKGGETRDDFNQIVQTGFPHLISIASRLVEETDVEAWEMLHIIMKTYKHAIYVCLLQHGESWHAANFAQSSTYLHISCIRIR